MPDPVDLLLITRNRRQYLEHSIRALLATDSHFRLYCWDNGSTDGTADVIASLNDPRITSKHYSSTNMNQTHPCLWFLEKSRASIVGKLDDDNLLPAGWIERLAPLVRDNVRLGMLGAWTFMPNDFYPDLARKNVVRIGAAEILRATHIAGCSFLSRKEHLQRYLCPRVNGLPVDRIQMTRDGLISGYPLPLIEAHNMDDPRSPHCLYTRTDTLHPSASFTARRLGFSSPEEYAEWIASNAYFQQRYSVSVQLWWTHIERSRAAWARIASRLLEPWKPQGLNLRRRRRPRLPARTT